MGYNEMCNSIDMYLFLVFHESTKTSHISVTCLLFKSCQARSFLCLRKHGSGELLVARRPCTSAGQLTISGRSHHRNLQYRRSRRVLHEIFQEPAHVLGESAGRHIMIIAYMYFQPHPPNNHMLGYRLPIALAAAQGNKIQA